MVKYGFDKEIKVILKNVRTEKPNISCFLLMAQDKQQKQIEKKCGKITLNFLPELTGNMLDLLWQIFFFC